VANPPRIGEKEVRVVRLRFARFGALCGVLFVVFLTVGNQMVIAGEGPADTGAQVLRNIQRHQTVQNSIGWAMALVGFAAFMLFLGYLRERLRTPGDWCASAAGLAGAITVAIKVGSVAFEYADRLRASSIDGGVARALQDTAGGAFVICGLTFTVFTLAAGVAGLSAGRLAMPRWLAWSGIGLGVIGLITPIIGIISSGSYVPAPWLLEIVWLGVLAVVWTVRPNISTVDMNRSALTEVTVAPVPSGAGS
jgi:hypothetical protein